MSILLTIAVIALIFIVIFQIAKASEYVTVLRGEGKGLRQSNKINGALMITFLVLGLVGVWYCNDLYFGKTNDKISVDSSHIEVLQSDKKANFETNLIENISIIELNSAIFNKHMSFESAVFLLVKQGYNEKEATILLTNENTILNGQNNSI